ncbi:replication restart helicase PriA [Breznakia pachnodae]|uniref:Replication restart protein PriA n=1 Tax=Breznakia pachnodae TaxID=265178 RepID=A0ABU0E507_9FIRM|nr:primosomal protein N' [Breznakia pachnodae]MDQ0361901.1 primosomal protein N' (replication factor Y) [Breznakia pachnodae]
MRVADIYIEYSASAIDRSFRYACEDPSVEVGMRVKVNFAGRDVIGFVVAVSEMANEDVANLGYSLSYVKERIDEYPLLNEEAFDLASYMAKICVAPLISCFQAMLPAKLKPKSTDHHVRTEVYVTFVQEMIVKGKRQQDAIEYMREHKKVKRSEFNQHFSCLKRLEELGVVELSQEERSADLDDVIETYSPMDLNQEQQTAVDMIRSKKGYGVHLLHGVTGSGKTEVFLHLAKEVLDEGKQVLILVPEISLTPQMVSRVKGRFGKAVAIYHSSLNNQEKYEQFKLVFEKKVSIVVGTRSAAFMPFDNLGLIIMDEEHDQSYKQDSTPRYHCRDIAIKRGEYHNCPVVLASATPSLESYARAYKGVYQLVELTKRIYDNVPETKLIDMKQSMRSSGNYLVSKEMREAIEERLAKNEQVIILLNRRGYAPILRCVDCGEVKKCPHCDLALNYHKTRNELVCHMCDYHEPFVQVCSKCGSTRLKYMGFGTQKLEEHLQEMFPSSRILRMDADTTRHKNAHEKLLTKFGNHEYDILVGTQMISKGLDFENVTLVGILNGDALLSRSDYRSVELTFDLLVQASGRSGRGEKNGEVLIQVYDCKHYAITCAQNNDYSTFFKKEMQFRHLGNYPPFSYLASIIFSSLKEEQLHDEVMTIADSLSVSDVKKLGPVELLRRNDEHRMRIVFKSKDFEALLQVVREVQNKHMKYKHKSKLEIDINPLYME